MMKIDNNGFCYQFDRNSYLDQIKADNLCSMAPHYVFCGSSAYKNRDAILGTIGEGFERQILLNCMPQRGDRINTINMRNLKAETIIVNENVQNYFYDTCGLSTHRESKKCIFNSMSEFIERQSFILSYLAKLDAKKLVHNSFVKSLLPKELEEISIYDISIINSFKVCLGYGKISDTKFAIGIGSGNNYKTALINLIREVFPLREIRRTRDTSIKTNYLDYQDKFNMLDTDTILQAYDYLRKKSVELEIEEDTTFSLGETIDELYIKWKICPHLITFFDEKYVNRKYKNAKNCKVIDLNYFPSLAVNTFSDSIYNNVEKITNLKLNRQINFIPFP